MHNNLVIVQSKGIGNVHDNDRYHSHCSTQQLLWKTSKFTVNCCSCCCHLLIPTSALGYHNWTCTFDSPLIGLWWGLRIGLQNVNFWPSFLLPPLCQSLWWYERTFIADEVRLSLISVVTQFNLCHFHRPVLVVLLLPSTKRFAKSISPAPNNRVTAVFVTQIYLKLFPSSSCRSRSFPSPHPLTEF